MPVPLLLFVTVYYLANLVSIAARFYTAAHQFTTQTKKDDNTAGMRLPGSIAKTKEKQKECKRHYATKARE